MNLLSRNELKSIIGGDYIVSIEATCTANCSDGIAVACPGSRCVAVDDKGCSAIYQGYPYSSECGKTIIVAP